MDLRARLVGGLVGYFVLLIVLACVLIALALREDVLEEVDASSRLVDLMLAMSDAGEHRLARVESLIAEGGMRHLAVTLERDGEPVAQEAAAGGVPRWLAAVLPHALFDLAEQRIRIDGATVVIKPDPASETSEILAESARMLGLFVLFVFVAGFAAWRTVGVALRPGVELERGLVGLLDETPRTLPAFELREFDRIARTMESIAHELALAREAERQMGRRLIQVQEEERRALARELHDEIGQTLAALGLAAAYIERHAGTAEREAIADCGREIREGVATVSGQVSGILKRLRPHGLDELGLLEALNDLLDFWQGRQGTAAIFARLPTALPALPEAAALSIYRTVQEALTNAHRHGDATHVDVELAVAVAGAFVELRIEDDGRGCTEEQLSRSSGGVLGMRERARIAGGELVFEKGRAGGLALRLRLPVAGLEEGRHDPIDVAG